MGNLCFATDDWAEIVHQESDFFRSLALTPREGGKHRIWFRDQGLCGPGVWHLRYQHVGDLERLVFRNECAG